MEAVSSEYLLDVYLVRTFHQAFQVVVRGGLQALSEFDYHRQLSKTSNITTITTTQKHNNADNNIKTKTGCPHWNTRDGSFPWSLSFGDNSYTWRCWISSIQSCYLRITQASFYLKGLLRGLGRHKCEVAENVIKSCLNKP